MMRAWWTWWAKLKDWVKDRKTLLREKEEISLANSKNLDVVIGLDYSLAEAVKKYQGERYERLITLSAIAYQMGGSFRLPRVFVEIIQKGGYELEISLDGESEYVFALVDEKNEQGKDRGGENTFSSPPFQPGEAANPDPDYYPDDDEDDDLPCKSY